MVSIKKTSPGFCFVFLTEKLQNSADCIAILRSLLYIEGGDIYGELLTKTKTPSFEVLRFGTAGAYFVTICTQNRRHLLTRIVGRGLAPAEIQYTEYGQIARKQLLLLEQRYPSLKIDQYVIMPNHIHAILMLSEASEDNQHLTLTDIECAYKSLTTRERKKVRPIDKLFRTSFYEHVIRGHEDYDEIAEYIVNNPKQWELDNLYSEE